MSPTLKERQHEIMQGNMNKIHHIDCLEFMKQVPDDYFQLLIIDPPYFKIKGEFDFIWKTFDDYLSWMDELAKEFKRIISDNGSLYLYGHAKRIAYKQVIFDKYFNLENNLVWYKPDSRTKKGIGEYRSYAPSTERILFYSNEVGRTGLEVIIEEYIKPKNPFGIYLKREFEKANITRKEIAKLFPSKTGGVTGCVSNWLSGNNVITEDQYCTIRKYLNGNYLRKEYEDLRKEYEDLRRPFNNTRYEDVLFFNQEIHNYSKYKHPTQKPPSLTRELIKVSSNKNTKIFIPFIGSGTEAEACKSLGLDWCGCELEADYIEIANKRLEQVQGSLF